MLFRGLTWVLGKLIPPPKPPRRVYQLPDNWWEEFEDTPPWERRRYCDE